MSGRAVYAAINAVASELSLTGIGKNHVNQVEGYKYRSIDDVLETLAPLLAKHRLCVLPRAAERVVTERVDEMQHLLLNVALKVAFTLTSAEDGSSHTIEVYGEALDGCDKATAKAMSAAYKSAMLQTFCIPVGAGEDADRSAYRLAAKVHEPEPVQGWQQWCADIADIISVCESAQAIAMVQERNRELLKALGREQPTLYGDLGQAFASRREALQKPAVDRRSAGLARTRSPKRPKAPRKIERRGIVNELQDA
jgi:hypothetical protein